MGGLTSNATYFVVGKLSGNGAGANRMQASLFPNGAFVTDFTLPGFQWMLTALGSASYNPLITDIQFVSLLEGNYTVSNVWIGDANTVPEPASAALFLLSVLPILSARRPRTQNRGD